MIWGAGLRQGINGVQRLVILRQFPIMSQFVLVQRGPLHDEAQRTRS